MTSFDYDLFVIGAGSGGVRAARASAAYGARVVIAEEDRVGGTCVIRGCVPKKLLVFGATFAEDLRDAGRLGWDLGGRVFDWRMLRDNVLEEVARNERAYSAALARHGVDVIMERATIVGPQTVRLASGREITAGRVLIATGARPLRPACAGGALAVTSNEVFGLAALPKRVVIAGAGYIANEFAGIFRAFGAEVTLVTRGDAILRGYDAQLSGRLLEISRKRGLRFVFESHLEEITRGEGDALRVAVRGAGTLDADLVLFATGRAPNVEGLGLEDVGVAVAGNGAVEVDADGRTSVESIYAVGDVTDRKQLTPVAIREGQAFADTVFGGKPTRVDYSCIPSAVFSQPPLAGVGMTEAEARTRLPAVDVYTSDFRPMKNVLAGRDERAFYKMVVDAETDVVVGIHMIGPDAPEILQAAVVAVTAKLTKAHFDATMALHPTMAEELVLMKAAPPRQ